MAISKQVGCAVQRNRIRRRIREAFRASPPPSGAYLVIVRARAATASSGDLFGGVDDFLASLP